MPCGFLHSDGALLRILAQGSDGYEERASKPKGPAMRSSPLALPSLFLLFASVGCTAEEVPEADDDDVVAADRAATIEACVVAPPGGVVAIVASDHGVAFA